LKYWRGYIIAALLGLVTWVLVAFAKEHSALVDMIYPYTTRLIMTSLAQWSSTVTFCLWQVIAVILVVLVLATVVLMIVLRWNFIQWLGWVLAGGMLIFCMHTGVYGLNQYSSSLSQDIRLVEREYSVSMLVEATTYYRDLANQLSVQVPRDSEGKPQYPSFQELAEQAADGFDNLVYKEYLAVFAGSTVPVKELGWADMYTSMGITGVTMPLTGEAAVNPQTPVVALPYVMCHEMAHRMCIAPERDANFSAFLACDANTDPIFRYSAYFMAFRDSYNALAAVGTSTSQAAAKQIYQGIGKELMKDLTDYRQFFQQNQKQTATKVATTVNDTYIKVSGDESGVKSYGEVCDLLVRWYMQEIYLPAHQEEEITFDPTDKNQVDLTERYG